MYICICHGVSKTEIRRLISQGALTLDALQRLCRAGTNCGSCLDKLKAMLKEEKREVDVSPSKRREIPHA